MAEAISLHDTVAGLRRELEAAQERSSYFEQTKKHEYDARLAAERTIGKLQSEAENAAERERRHMLERDAAKHRLSFAEGYIAALKGEPYQPAESLRIGDDAGMPAYFPSIVRSAR